MEWKKRIASIFVEDLTTSKVLVSGQPFLVELDNE